MLRDLAKAISITTFRVWKNNIGKGEVCVCGGEGGGVKDFFKEGVDQRKGVI